MDDQIRCAAGGVTLDSVPDVHQLVQKNSGRAAEAETQLPHDLVAEVLLCSSAKSLLRFRCLSKFLCSIINNKGFINWHHKRSVENKKRHMLIAPGTTPSDQTGKHLNRSLQAFDVDTALEVNINKPNGNDPYEPYGYCKGLVLLFVDSLKLALWNPSTKQYRNLPLCPIKVPEGGYCVTIGMGLGYGSRSTCDDYKVVLIEDVMIDNDTHDLQVWIFRLRSNSWKRYHENFPHRKDESIYFGYFGYFADGSLYWLCQPSKDEYDLVIFRVANETMVSETLPRTSSQIYLHVLDGCLCKSYFSPRKRELFTFFIRKKDGNAELKWCKLFSITPEVPLLFADIFLFKYVRVLGYSKDGGDKIMMDMGFEFIVYFDLKARSFTTIGTKILGDDGWLYPFLCHESLVSVCGRKSKVKNERKRKLSQSHCIC